jgi:hypothetical protein
MTAPATTRQGVYDGMSDAEYHAHPALSSSGARKLLPPSCPAIFRHEQEHGAKPRRVWDLGHAAHLMVLGVGPEPAVVDADDWRTKDARQQRDDARERGAVPLLKSEHATAVAMAEALCQHPIANALFTPGTGLPEQSLFWTDQRTGVDCRARLDWLPALTSGRLIISDYKTAADASPDAITRAMHNFGYHQQAAWYLDGIQALGYGDSGTAFVFVVQEKTPPYLVTVVQPDPPALRIGAHLNREAIDTYRSCIETGRWPGYSDDVEIVSLPHWIEREYEGVAW